MQSPRGLWVGVPGQGTTVPTGELEAGRMPWVCGEGCSPPNVCFDDSLWRAPAKVSGGREECIPYD